MKSLSKSSKAKKLLLKHCHDCYMHTTCRAMHMPSYPDKGCESWTTESPKFDGDDYHSRAYQSIKNFASSEDFKGMIKRNYYDEE